MSELIKKNKRRDNCRSQGYTCQEKGMGKAGSGRF